MDKITICDLEVHYHVGVTDQERTEPQRLLITVEMGGEIRKASASDNLADTIDYFAVCQRLLHFGDAAHWQLIETLATDIAEMIMDDFGPASVVVEVKKFVIPEARHVSVTIARSR